MNNFVDGMRLRSAIWALTLSISSSVAVPAAYALPSLASSACFVPRS